jgi:hypothetical protein
MECGAVDIRSEHLRTTPSDMPDVSAAALLARRPPFKAAYNALFWATYNRQSVGASETLADGGVQCNAR